MREFGADVYIYNRTTKKAKDLSKKFKVKTISRNKIADAKFDIIINCTPVGSYQDHNNSILSNKDIPSNSTVMDIITYPIETKLLKEAKKSGAKTISGERMLLHQAVGQFELWFNTDAPIKTMEEALYDAMKNYR